MGKGYDQTGYYLLFTIVNFSCDVNIFFVHAVYCRTSREWGPLVPYFQILDCYIAIPINLEAEIIILNSQNVKMNFLE